MRSEVSLSAPAHALAYERDTARNELIDVARGIAIVCVVLGHNRAISRSSPDLVHALFLFHVPLFFLLSGWVLGRGSFSTASRKLAARLLIPCFAAALVVGAIKSFARDQSPAQTLLGILWGTGQTLPLSQLWFLPALFLALLPTLAVERLRFFGDPVWKWLVAIAVAATFAAAFGQLPPYADSRLPFPAPIGLPWSVDLLPLCLVFVWSGCLLRHRPALLARVMSPAVWLSAAVLFAAMVGIAEVDMNLRVFTPFLPALLGAVCGCIVTMRIAGFASRFGTARSVLSLVGRHTMIIFILHVSIQKALLALLEQQRLSGGLLWLVGALTSLVAVVTPILLERHLLTRIPVLHFLFSGKRVA